MKLSNRAHKIKNGRLFFQNLLAAKPTNRRAQLGLNRNNQPNKLNYLSSSVWLLLNFDSDWFEC